MVAPGRGEGGRGAANGGWVDLCGGEEGEVTMLSSSEQQEGQLRAKHELGLDRDAWKALCQTIFCLLVIIKVNLVNTTLT